MSIKHYLVLALLFISAIILSQNSSSPRYIDSLEYIQKLDSIKSIYTQVTKVPPQYELSFFTALSFYPELIKTRIKVKHSSIKTTLCMRPTLFSMVFNKKDNRLYILRINRHKRNGNTHLNEVPYQARIGLFGHEFSHIKDFNSTNTFGYATRGWWYLFNKSRTSFEHSIDQLTIEQGLGWQLYEWSNFVQNSKTTSKEYKKLKRERYLTPDEIITTLDQD